jgi:uncharacterized protein YbbK (DUF523 family)
MEKVLVSACLLGKRVRYDGNAVSVSEKILEQWLSAGRVVPVCPEVDAGMSIPRPPAEIICGDGYGVWNQAAMVVDNTGTDVTAAFKKGAQHALVLCRKFSIKVAVLTEHSPSCGSSVIYDGSFTRHKIIGAGVTTALLRENGIEVFSQRDIESANNLLQQIDQ